MLRGKLALLFLLLSGAAALKVHAQKIVGQWQGTLQSPKPLRIVLMVSTDDAGRLKAYMVSVDQTPEHFPVTSISIRHGQLDYSITTVRGTYHGKLSSDGGRIEGTWTQGKSSALNFQHATGETSWLPKSKIRLIHVAPGVSLEVVDWGGNGPPLIFLAGLGNTAHIFDNFAPKFVPEYHVYGITRRGFGASSSPAPNGSNYSADQLGDDVLKVMDTLGLKKPVLIGHSIAGEELSSIGSRYPGRVAGLIYLDAGYPYALYSADFADRSPNCCWLDAHLDAEGLESDLNAYLAAAPGTDQKQIVSKLLADLPPLEKDLEADQERVELQPPPAGSGARAKPTSADAEAAIEEGEQRFTDIQAPILAIFANPHSSAGLAHMTAASKAEWNALFQSQTSAQITAFEKLKSAKVVVIPNADHYVFRSNQPEVEKDIKDFLATLNLNGS